LTVHFAYENVLLGIKEKIMVTSYGETSGFAPVFGDELITVNGGIAPVAIGIGLVAVGICYAVTTFHGCSQPGNSGGGGSSSGGSGK
jgi:hypothetical protein